MITRSPTPNIALRYAWRSSIRRHVKKSLGFLKNQQREPEQPRCERVSEYRSTYVDFVPPFAVRTLDEEGRVDQERGETLRETTDAVGVHVCVFDALSVLLCSRVGRLSGGSLNLWRSALFTEEKREIVVSERCTTTRPYVHYLTVVE